NLGRAPSSGGRPQSAGLGPGLVLEAWTAGKDLLHPLRMMLPGPLELDVAAHDSSERMPRPRIDQGEIQMAGQQDERDPHQSVVQDDRPREAESCVTLAVPEQDPGDREKHRERRGYRGVELLARVEAALLGRIAAEPEAVVQIEPVEVVQGPA